MEGDVLSTRSGSIRWDWCTFRSECRKELLQLHHVLPGRASGQRSEGRDRALGGHNWAQVNRIEGRARLDLGSGFDVHRGDRPRGEIRTDRHWSPLCDSVERKIRPDLSLDDLRGGEFGRGENVLRRHKQGRSRPPNRHAYKKQHRANFDRLYNSARARRNRASRVIHRGGYSATVELNA